jgi:hypothetical protein
MPNTDDSTSSRSANKSHFVIDRNIPIAVLIMLAIQFVVGIWGGAVFYTTQKSTAETFSENFNQINIKFEKIESTMFSRQEAILQLDYLRQNDIRYESELRQVRQDVREILFKRVSKDGVK